jgi:hypothetical protein
MIEDRPLSEFEVDCIIESQKRLREDEIYMQLQSEVNQANKNLTCDQEKVIFLNYQYGFFNGEMFALVKMEKLHADAEEIKDL